MKTETKKIRTIEGINKELSLLRLLRKDSSVNYFFWTKSKSALAPSSMPPLPFSGKPKHV
jgi:hypothetical protein